MTVPTNNEEAQAPLFKIFTRARQNGKTRDMANQIVAAANQAGVKVEFVEPVIDTDDLEALGRLIWDTSRADEGSISVTGADIIANAILAARRPSVSGDDSKAEALDAYRDHLREMCYSTAEVTLMLIGFDAGFTDSQQREVEVTDERETHEDAMRDVEAEAIRLYTEKMWHDLPEKIKSNHRLAAAALDGGDHAE